MIFRLFAVLIIDGKKKSVYYYYRRLTGQYEFMNKIILLDYI